MRKRVVKTNSLRQACVRPSNLKYYVDDAVQPLKAENDAEARTLCYFLQMKYNLECILGSPNRKKSPAKNRFPTIFHDSTYQTME